MDTDDFEHILRWLRALPMGAVIEWNDTLGEAPFTGYVDVAVKGYEDYNWAWTIVDPEGADEHDRNNPMVIIVPHDGTAELELWKGKKVTVGSWSPEVISAALHDWAFEELGLHFSFNYDGEYISPSRIKADEEIRAALSSTETYAMGENVRITSHAMDQLLAMSDEDRTAAAEIIAKLSEELPRIDIDDVQIGEQ